MYSTRGTCDRLRTATILVKDKRIVGAGYNGSVSGADHCDDCGHLMVHNHCIRTIHGEQNAIYNALSDLRGGTAYVIATPCLNCVKALIQKGITRIVYVGKYNNAKGKKHVDKYVKDLCEASGILLEEFVQRVENIEKILERASQRLRGQGGILKS